MDDLVHLRVQVRILLRKRLRSVFLVESASVSLDSPMVSFDTEEVRQTSPVCFDMPKMQVRDQHIP
jgi:hypothetical protein